MLAKVHADGIAGHGCGDMIEVICDFFSPVGFAGRAAMGGLGSFAPHVDQQSVAFQLQRVPRFPLLCAEQGGFVQRNPVALSVHRCSSPAIRRAIRLMMPCRCSISISESTRFTTRYLLRINSKVSPMRISSVLVLSCSCTVSR